MSEAMIVVAIKRGYYGGKTRYEGERFAIASAEQFSKRWMVDPKGPDMTDEYRSLEQSYRSANEKPQSRGISDDQLLAEITQSAGVVSGLRAENLKLKEANNALRAQVEELLSKGGGVREDAAGGDAGDDEGEPGDTDEPANVGASEDAGGVVAGPEAPVRRVRRTN